MLTPHELLSRIMDFVLTAEALVHRHQCSSGLEPSSFYFIEESRWITAWISVCSDGFLIGVGPRT